MTKSQKVSLVINVLCETLHLTSSGWQDMRPSTTIMWACWKMETHLLHNGFLETFFDLPKGVHHHVKTPAYTVYSIQGKGGPKLPPYSSAAIAYFKKVLTTINSVADKQQV
jgi:hypothetical protein